MTNFFRSAQNVTDVSFFCSGRILGLHAGLTKGFNGGAGHAAGGAVLFDLTAVMSRQITKALASRETDHARLPRPLAF